MIVGHIGGAGAPYEIQKSLRFRASASAYLSRTPTVAGNRKTWTWSGWVKRGALSGQIIFAAGTIVNGAASNRDAIGITGSDALIVELGYTGSSYSGSMTTTAVFHDPSAWYHVVVAVDTTNATAENRCIIYVNGTRQTVTINTAFTLNYQGQINNTAAHRIGANVPDGFGGAVWNYLDGYFSEINFIDGQALDAAYFGEVSAETGAWIPKKYTGTYGTNGFYLPFNDGSNLTNLTSDKLGNGNNWTANNFSLTSGATYDWMDDTPTNNFAVLNAVHAGRSTLTNGNLTASGAADLPTIIPDSGTWYFERGGSSQTWAPPDAFPSGSGDYNFGQRPWQSTGPTGGQKALCTKNLPTGTITTSGTFSGNASTDGPFVYLNGVPTAMTINDNAVTFGNHADKLANGFKVRSSSASYNSAGSNTYSITSTGTKFKYSNAQGNP